MTTIKDGNVLYGADLIKSFGKLEAQMAYQCLQANDVFTNRDNLGADEFLDSNGTNNTVDTGTSTAYYDTVNDNYELTFTDAISGEINHDPDSFTNPNNAFDDDKDTYANKNSTNATTSDMALGKTFSSATHKLCYIKIFKEMDNYASVSVDTVKLETYDGATWTTRATVFTGDGGFTKTYEGVVDISSYTNIQGIRLRFQHDSGANDRTSTNRVYQLEAGEYTTPQTVETNEIIDCGSAPDSIVVYGHTDLPTGTSITVDVSDDGGNTFAVTGGSLGEYIDTTTLTGSSIALKFNLATTDTSVSPKLYGYGLAITDK